MNFSLDFEMKLDFSNKGLKRIEAQVSPNNVESIIFDDNSITKLENLNTYVNLKQFSIANNHLVELRGITNLKNLIYLDLMNNSLTNIDLLRDLKQIQWLNISGNEIKSLDSLKACVHLKYIDSSDNSITQLPDLSTLNELHTLNLNGNLIDSLKNSHTYLSSKRLQNLFVSNNAIEDLNDICHLSSLDRLDSLEIANNPCVEISTNHLFDYRPFVVNWCLNLKCLDGYEITNKEMLKAEWLLSQGKGRHFRPGQHFLLIEYLAKTCPLKLSSTANGQEEVRFSKILEKQQHINESIDFSAKLDSPRSNFKLKSYTEDIQEISERTTTTTHNSFNATFNSQSKAFKMTINEDNSNVNSRTYEDYDSRPIKPLKSNLEQQQQLNEYHELTPEELELAKKKREQFRIRSKTTDNVKISKPNVQSVTNKPHQTKHQQQQQQQQAQQASIIPKSTHQEEMHKKSTKLVKPRSKTQHDIRLDDMHKQQKAQYNPNLYSPNQKAAQVKSTKNLFTLKKTQIKPKQAQVNTDLSRKIDVPKIECPKSSNQSSFSFDDLCATKIQAAWRGYCVRNKSIEVRKRFDQLKYKRVLDHTKLMRNDLNELLDQHAQFAKIMYTAFDEFWKMVKNLKINQTTESTPAVFQENTKLKEKLKLLEQRCGILEEKLYEYTSKETQNQMTQTSSTNENILVENVNHSNKQQAVRLQPPLKVRLQKLNEKCVTLKWDHNPDNQNCKHDGYRVYINGVLRGNLKSVDVKALINGIKEAGEYRITVRSFNDKEESPDSNVVITRVKKKSSQDDSSTTTTESADENISRCTQNADFTKNLDNTMDRNTRATTAPIIMDKLKHFTPNSFNLVSNIIDHRQQNVSPRKEKNFAKNLKERLEQHEITSRISPPKTNEEIPFTRKQSLSTHPIPILQRDTKQSTHLSTSPIDGVSYKPPKSPPRGPSPSSTLINKNENQSSTGFDIKDSIKKSTPTHKKSNSADLQQSSPIINQQNTQHQPQSVANLLNIIKSAKFSTSEPNLSLTAHSGKSDGSVEYVRKSIQFDDEPINENANKENQQDEKRRSLLSKKLSKIFPKDSLESDSIALT